MGYLTACCLAKSALNGVCGHLYLVLDLNAKASNVPSQFTMLLFFFFLSILLWLCYTITMFLLCPSCYLALALKYEVVMYFIKFLLCIYWDDCMIIFFKLFMWCITFSEMQMINNPSKPVAHFTWSEWVIWLMYIWIWLASIFLLIFASMYYRMDISLWLSFSVVFIYSFGLRWYWLLRRFGRIASLCIVWKSFWRIWIILEMFGRIPH